MAKNKSQINLDLTYDGQPCLTLVLPDSPADVEGKLLEHFLVEAQVKGLCLQLLRQEGDAENGGSQQVYRISITPHETNPRTTPGN